MSPQPTATAPDLDAPLYTERDVADVLAPHIAAGRLQVGASYPTYWFTPLGSSGPVVQVTPAGAGGAWSRDVCLVEVGPVESDDAAIDRDGFDVRVGYASPGRVLDAVLAAAFGAARAAVAS